MQGWYIPIIAKIEEDNRIRLYAGSTVSRGTQLISNDAREMCVGMMETWTPTYDMLKGEQIEKYTKNEEIRREIHEKYMSSM